MLQKFWKIDQESKYLLNFTNFMNEVNKFYVFQGNARQFFSRNTKKVFKNKNKTWVVPMTVSGEDSQVKKREGLLCIVRRKNELKK